MHALDLDWLQLSRLDLVTLEERFIEEEVQGVIKTLPSDKALGPNGFTAVFPGELGDYQSGSHTRIQHILALVYEELSQH
jgi:hypothetical protein